MRHSKCVRIRRQHRGQNYSSSKDEMIQKDVWAMPEVF